MGSILEKKTKVIFRVFRDGDVIALMPEIPSDYNGRFCDSYMHVESHSGANYDHIISTTKPATEAESKDLLNELIGIGYDVEVYRLRTESMRENYQKNLKRVLASDCT